MVIVSSARPLDAMNTEFKHKLAQVRGLLKPNKASAVLLCRQSNFSWLTCGGEAHVALISERAACQLVVTAKDVFLIANRIELPRLLNEEVRSLPLKPVIHDWYHATGAAQALEKIADPATMISDTGDFGTRPMPELISPLRYSLHPAEVKRLRELCRLAEKAMAETCRAIKPGQDEFEIGAQLSAACQNRRLTPVVLLVAVDDRIRQYRHPLPTAKKLRRIAMLVLCARQHGLIVSLTRLVHFGEVPADLARRHDAACAVDAVFISNTRIGTPVREIFRRGIATYAKQGFPDEWQLHHQGGPCGYQTREYLATSAAAGVVLQNQAFAWNPSITGTKSEDTILATPRGPQILTASHNWPSLKFTIDGETYLRPDILVQ